MSTLSLPSDYQLSNCISLYMRQQFCSEAFPKEYHWTPTPFNLHTNVTIGICSIVSTMVDAYHNPIIWGWDDIIALWYLPNALSWSTKTWFDTLNILKDHNTDASLEQLQAMAIPNAMISGVLSIIHPLLYKAGIQGIEKLKMETTLNNSIMERALVVWPMAFTNISLISNRACPLHCDPHLSGNWYDITANVGDHSSCIMSILTLGVELVYNLQSWNGSCLLQASTPTWCQCSGWQPALSNILYEGQHS
ncbi:hypothetical protein EDC04DRAFT_2610928 [Pisolithus marmoratus]|nr:hypothetical protein EDC04DRAFT_2610928 [Pisolithus marmoratus]